MFPCKQNGGEKKVLLLLRSLSHRHIKSTKWIGGFGNAVSYQRCRLFQTFCTYWAETRTKAALNPTSNKTWPATLVKTSPAWKQQDPQIPSSTRWKYPAKSTSPPVRLKGSGCTQCKARASLDQFPNRFL